MIFAEFARPEHPWPRLDVVCAEAEPHRRRKLAGAACTLFSARSLVHGGGQSRGQTAVSHLETSFTARIEWRCSSFSVGLFVAGRLEVSIICKSVC